MYIHHIIKQGNFFEDIVNIVLIKIIKEYENNGSSDIIKEDSKTIVNEEIETEF